MARFHEFFRTRPVRATHISLFRAHPEGVAEHLLEQDVIYVGGGSSANLMAIWAVHGLGDVLRRAWEAGVVLAGVSAGAICWFTAGLTNSLGPHFVPIAGLGLVEGGFCPHADSDPGRLVALHDLVDRGLMPPTLRHRRRRGDPHRRRRAAAPPVGRAGPGRPPRQPRRGRGDPGAAGAERLKLDGPNAVH